MSVYNFHVLEIQISNFIKIKTGKRRYNICIYCNIMVLCNSLYEFKNVYFLSTCLITGREKLK